MTDLVATVLICDLDVPLNVYAVEDCVMKGGSLPHNEIRAHKRSLRALGSAAAPVTISTTYLYGELFVRNHLRIRHYDAPDVLHLFADEVWLHSSQSMRG